MHINYRPLMTLDEMNACLDLQIEVWGFKEIDVVPLPLLVIAKKYGGFLYGAFADQRLVGFVYSLPARGRERWLQWSHMTAVAPNYQGQGIGERLKRAQWNFARNQGYDLIAWTFDPLETRNAYFNFAKLGVVARFFEPNVYGITTGRIHFGLPTDRLVAEWWTHWNRDAAVQAQTDTAIALIAVHRNRGRPWPGDVGTPSGAALWIPVPAPADYPQRRDAFRRMRATWQTALRDAFQRAFTAGYVAVGFVRDIPELGLPGYFLVPRDRLQPPLPSW